VVLTAQNLQDLAKSHVISNKKDFSLNVNSPNDLQVVNMHTTGESDLTHVYMNQLFDGIKIYNAIINVSLDQSGNVVHSGNRSVNHSKNANASPGLSVIQAVQSAALSFGQNENNATTMITQSLGATQKSVLENAEISYSDILAELMYVNQNGTLVLTWSIAYHNTSDNTWMDTKIDAFDGSVVEQTSWTVECNFGSDEDPHDHSNHSHSYSKEADSKSESPSSNYKKSSALANDDYFVSPIPDESPNHGPLGIVNAPWTNNIDPAANPFTAAIGQSWHNDGIMTHFTTRGNNVWAVEDTDADNNQAAGFSPTSQLGPVGQQYNFIPDFTMAPTAYQEALITNLFYWNNLSHDISYHYGFNEECGNFQVTNATGQGLDGDAVQADAIDGSGTNNANFSTPPDGTSGRMQMFEFTQPVSQNTTFSGSVSLIADGVAEVFANVPWTPANDGNLVLVLDTGGTSEACGVPAPGNISNAAAITGNVALLDRGSCNFTEKVENAEAAGAISVVVCNNAPGAPIPMGGTPANPINIPSIMISQADCNTIKANLPGVSVSFDPNAASVNRTSDYDNGIIAHEYAHGISIRLTGGAANSGCLSGEEQMGEGWSDYFGLILTMQPGDTGPMPRGIGTYAIGQATTGLGIRNFPYSTDFAVNPETYGSLPPYTGGAPHPIGSVWVNMIWDMTWDLIDLYGMGTDLYDSDFANVGTPASPGTFGGQNLALRLVIEAMKLQPCNPGFVDGRDAILAADQALYGGLHQCLIWGAFAGRGLGVSADQGSPNTVTDGTEAFDLPSATIEKVASAATVTDGSSITYDLNVEIFSCAGGQGAVTITDALDPALNITSAVCPTPAVVTTAGNNITITHPGFGGNIGAFSCTIITTVNTMSTAPINQTFFDDVESGNMGFVVNDITGTGSNQWSIVNTASSSPTNSWFVDNGLLSKTTALESQPITLGTDPSMSFSHSYDTELGWDGGFIEVSTDDGVTWDQLGSDNFLCNGYNSEINANSPNTSIVGRDAWSGDSGGFIKSIADLSAFASSTVRIRFLFGEDNFVNEIGWWVDDIEILDGTAFALIENTANITPDVGDMMSSTASTCVEIVPCMPGVLGLEITGQATSCQTGNDGTATVTASGGVAPYTFQWSNGIVAATTVGLTAGTVSVTVTDANGCAETISTTIAAGPDPCAMVVTSDIPTMGEWGLICLALCFLIFGVVVIRQTESAFEV